MQLGFIGLGRMGSRMVKRLRRDAHEVVVYNRNIKKVEEAVRDGAIPAASVAELAKKLTPPRAVWLMVPAGDPVTQVIEELKPYLGRNDIIIDGGNSRFSDSIRRAAELKSAGIHFLDVGTSGGVWGLEVGYCLMIGGGRAAFERLVPIFRTLAPPEGFAHVGPSGAGHFVKMVHNGIEYGMLQAYGEGFELLHAAEFGLDLRQIAHLWNQGGVVRSWLLELAERAFAADPKLASIRGYVEDSGEGRWTVLDAIERGVPATTIAHSLFARFLSRQADSFAAKVIAALRQEFGGHAVKAE